MIEVINDVRLSAEARLLILHVALMGDGPHELPYTHLSRLLNQAGEKKLRRIVRDAVECGWLERSRGGRSHSPLFAFSPAKAAGSNADNPAEIAGSNRNSPAEMAGSKTHSPAKTAGSSDSPAEMAGSSDSPAKAAGSNGPHTREARSVSVGYSLRDEGEEGGEDAGGGVSVKARTAIAAHRALFTGCRDALRDYLSARVPPSRQYGYVQAVAALLNGLDPTVWQLTDGSKIPDAERVPMLAVALNDLAGSDEAAMSRPVGDVANLRVKIGALLKARAYGGTDARRAHGAASQEERASRYPG